MKSILFLFFFYCGMRTTHLSFDRSLMIFIDWARVKFDSPNKLNDIRVSVANEHKCIDNDNVYNLVNNVWSCL